MPSTPGRSKGEWYLFSGVHEVGGEWVPFVVGGPHVKEQPPKRSPAGGTIEVSGDGRWLTVYAPAAPNHPDARDGLVPIRVYQKHGASD